ncbi:MAG: HEAT repeat domain-containing protein [Myxococcota bacterium]
MSKRPLSDIANPQTRIDEFDLRVRRGDPSEVVRTLLEGIGDVYPPLRQRAALTASDVDDDALHAVLTGLVQGERRVDPIAQAHGLTDDDVPPINGPVRQAACLALRGADDPESLDALLEAASDEDDDVRYQALVSLHHRDAPDAQLREVVDARLEDEDTEVQIVTAQIIADRGWTEFTQRIESLWRGSSGELRRQLAFVLADLSAEADVELAPILREKLVDQLIDALSNEQTASAAARALASLDADQARNELRGVVNKWFGHPLHKVEAAAALVELDDQVGREYLAKALQSHRKDARGYAMRLVGKLGLDAFFDLIAAKARSTDYHADTAVLALGDFGGDRAQNILEELATSHPDDDIRELAADTLEGLDLPQGTL